MHHGMEDLQSREARLATSLRFTIDPPQASRSGPPGRRAGRAAGNSSLSDRPQGGSSKNCSEDEATSGPVLAALIFYFVSRTPRALPPAGRGASLVLSLLYQDKRDNTIQNKKQVGSKPEAVIHTAPVQKLGLAYTNRSAAPSGCTHVTDLCSLLPALIFVHRELHPMALGVTATAWPPVSEPPRKSTTSTPSPPSPDFRRRSYEGGRRGRRRCRRRRRTRLRR